jgi:hypothetical protein
MTAKPRIDLHRTLQQIRTAAGAVICTYRFDPSFFEDYCMEKFGCLHRNNNITVLIDWGCYDELLAGTLRDRPNLANIRYLLQPITAKRVFHPKVFLFADEDKGSLLIGSANATRPGLTSNAELVGVFHYEQGKRKPRCRFSGLYSVFFRSDSSDGGIEIAAKLFCGVSN